MPKPLILLILTLVCGGGGYALGEIAQMADGISSKGTTTPREKVVFAAGQFTIPLFEGESVPYFLLTEINIEVETYDEVSILSSNRPHVRATVLESLFELERRGEIKPGVISPEVIQAAVKSDLEATFPVNSISRVLLDRLLIQETGRKS
jgi:hypothetical protein